MKINWKQEKETLKTLLEEGATLEEAATFYTVSRQRILQVVNLYFPEMTRQDFGSSKKRTVRLANRLEEIKIAFNRNAYQNPTDIERAQSSFFTRKRQNCRYKKWDWDIQMSDLEWPSHCPILGIELDWFAEKTQENSPSIDRLDNSKGYIKGNVAVMSWRANRIKNNGSAEEHHKIAHYLDHIFF